MFNSIIVSSFYHCVLKSKKKGIVAGLLCSFFSPIVYFLTFLSSQLTYKGVDYSKDRIYKEITDWKCVDRKCQGRLTSKNDQVIRET